MGRKRKQSHQGGKKQRSVDNSSSKEVVIDDVNGSAYTIFFDVRETVWSMVEFISTKYNQAIENDFPRANDGLMDIDASNIPVSFVSNKQKKKKQRERTAYNICHVNQQHTVSSTDYKFISISSNNDQNKLSEENVNRISIELVPPTAAALVDKYKLTIAHDTSIQKNTVYIRLLGLAQPWNDSDYSNNSYIARLLYFPLNAEEIGDKVDLFSNTFVVHYNDLRKVYQIQQQGLNNLLSNDWYEYTLMSKPLAVHTKYWDQRYRIFSRFDYGIQLDEESWYSITYENVARDIARKCIAFAKPSSASQDATDFISIDCFSGCGGNSIALAQQVNRVISVDIDANKVDLLRNNARVYDVEDTIDYKHEDVIDFLITRVQPSLLKFILARMILLGSINKEALKNTLYTSSCSENNDTISYNNATYNSPNKLNDFIKQFCEKNDLFNYDTISDIIGSNESSHSLFANILIASPPWGGPEYLSAPEFDLYTMLPCGDGFQLMALMAATAAVIAFVVPRNTTNIHLNVIALQVNRQCKVEDIVICRKMKLKVAYYYPL